MERGVAASVESVVAEASPETARVDEALRARTYKKMNNIISRPAYIV